MVALEVFKLIIILTTTKDIDNANIIYFLFVISKQVLSNIYVNPFISFTVSKPLMSSGSWLTLHNCEIFYSLAVNYDPAATDLIFVRVNISPGPGEGGSQLIF